jgi:hypothetical protein
LIIIFYHRRFESFLGLTFIINKRTKGGALIIESFGAEQRYAVLLCFFFSLRAAKRHSIIIVKLHSALFHKFALSFALSRAHGEGCWRARSQEKRV